MSVSRVNFQFIAIIEITILMCSMNVFLNLTEFPEKKIIVQRSETGLLFNNMILARNSNSAFKGPALNSGF